MNLDNNNNNNFNSQLESNKQNIDINQPSNNFSSQKMTNELNRDNNNTSNSNHKSSNKKSLIIYIIVAIAIILIGVGIGVFVSKSKTNDANNAGNENDKNNNLNGSDIKQIQVSDKDVLALSNEGDLYFIGGDSSGLMELEKYLYADDEQHNTIKKLASNVEKFYSSCGVAVYFIDRNQDLYYWGESYNNGFSNQAKEDYSGVKDISVYMNYCGFIINNNDELFIKNNDFTKYFCGLNKVYKDTDTKVANNVKSVFSSNFFGGYINSDNELYLSIADSNFKKIFDNVKIVVPYDFKKLLFLTNDNKLYIYDYGVDDVENDGLTLLKNDVSELTETYFKTTDGKFNLYSKYSILPFIKYESKLLYDSKNYSGDIYYGELDITDIKELIYYNFNKKIIYISNNNKLVLLDENNKEEISYNINNLEKIFEFVTKSNE